ncbi:hypothetical protein EON63_09695 [archaeon]|nr:MAG: hypothetical protein EON63_09695 [archaeon]
MLALLVIIQLLFFECYVQMFISSHTHTLTHCSPLNCDAGNMIRHGDMRAYRTMCTMYCVDYANK